MRNRNLAALGLICLGSHVAAGGVFINEVFINPPGSFDDTREFIELAGTPGMKLDGYAIVSLNGTQQRYYPLGSIPPAPIAQEIDELFSLDGLTLGANGLLVIGVGVPTNYPTVLSDTRFQQWNSLWNGGLDTSGKIENDGSNTFLLVRNRPGNTQANPSSPLGLRWGKDIPHDDDLVTPVIDSQTNQEVDQYGNGSIDSGQPNGYGGNTLDLKGESTPADSSDDLEIVDQISYEHDRGWEYDTDNRHVDLDSAHNSLPERRVRALDDPQGINPDCLSRVDYRTKGPGYPPVAGATGEGPNGNNWQDTATEQWVRGESIGGANGQGSAPFFYYDNTANATADAIQPYLTNVPVWLADGSGSDYNFAAANTYQIMAGRVNALAVPFIPGDADRDGDADADDIAMIASVFGDANWIFSNGFATAPEGDSGDPATQTRPWDVDGTGDNGIEPSDLQWTLNFLGNTNGRVVGVRYDSTTPSATGVYLNPSLPVVCTVTTAATLPPSRTLSTIQVGDSFSIVVSAQVTSGAINTASQENGVMQFVNDVRILSGGVIRATLVEPLGSFATTRSTLQTFAGASGDAGVRSVNGYTTSYTQGLGSAAQLYRVTFEAIAQGSTTIGFSPASATRLAASTPAGLKVGRTNNNGNPGANAYPIVAVTVVAPAGCPQAGCDAGDLNGDCVVNLTDLATLLANFGTGPVPPTPPTGGDTDGDGDVDLTDLARLLSQFGANCN